MQVHGNVCLSSVVVTQTLDWKLHAFDVLSEFDGNKEAADGPMLVILCSKLDEISLLYFELLQYMGTTILSMDKKECIR